MPHSLSAAVADGTISKSAVSGLSYSDVIALEERYPTALLLVRLRSGFADGRIKMTASELLAWENAGNDDDCKLIDGGYWKYRDVRDVLPVAGR